MLKRSVLLIVLLLCGFGIVLLVMNSQQTKDPLEPYNLILYEKNQEWNTNYALVPEQGMSQDELIQFITSMSFDEFREYLEEAHALDLEHPEMHTDRVFIDGKSYEK